MTRPSTQCMPPSISRIPPMAPCIFTRPNTPNKKQPAGLKTSCNTALKWRAIGFSADLSQKSSSPVKASCFFASYHSPARPQKEAVYHIIRIYDISSAGTVAFRGGSMLQSLLGCAGKDWLFCTMNTVQIVSVAQSTCLPLHTHFERETPDEKGRSRWR